MPSNPLRIAAFGVYLGSWLVLASAAIASAFPRLRQVSDAVNIGASAPVIIGTLLQIAAAAMITVSMNAGSLHPEIWELVGTLLLAPFGASLFVWAIWSAPSDADVLVTVGAYRWLRHPMYLSLFAMLLATGLLASSGMILLAAAGCYLVGSKLRIDWEEAELVRKFPIDFPRYSLRTPWRCLPGLW